MIDDAKPHLNLSRLSEREREDLLHRLDPDGLRRGRCLDHDRRREPRWIFRRTDVVAELAQPGGQMLRFLVLGRNLSAHGMAFIHGGFIYPRTRGQFLLPRVEGPSHLVGGAVVGCRHVEGPLHEVRVRFDEAIQPREYLSFDELAEGLPEDAVTVRELRGRAILCTSEPMVAKVVRHAFTPTGIAIAEIGSPAEIRRLLLRPRHGFDVILVDVGADREQAKRRIETLRRGEHGVPIVALSEQTDRSFLTEIMWEGADHVVRKPPEAYALYEVMLQLHRQQRSFAAAV